MTVHFPDALATALFADAQESSPSGQPLKMVNNTCPRGPISLCVHLLYFQTVLFLFQYSRAVVLLEQTHQWSCPWLFILLLFSHICPSYRLSINLSTCTETAQRSWRPRRAKHIAPDLEARGEFSFSSFSGWLKNSVPLFLLKLHPYCKISNTHPPPQSYFIF